ncbi:putative vesicle-mediated transport protein Vid24 [Cladophialophora carrionii]|uniref:Putative vesicle-mediated transport protein Vid24 n=1 Tax=Cladophialophora carrionii TaxID=86049 RepID=A0A1C1CU41_9EURO|nr:putative vesicle-mediated transport protein Vid24 [Cladophialophora carrionii]
MPTHAPNRPFSPPDPEITQSNVACPAPLTPPSDNGANEDTRRSSTRRVPHGDDEVIRRPVSDNTAAGMALMQEATMYATGPSLEEKMHTDAGNRSSLAADGADDEAGFENCINADRDMQTERLEETVPTADVAHSDERNTAIGQPGLSDRMQLTDAEPDSGLLSPPLSCAADGRTSSFNMSGVKPGIPSIDQELDWSNNHLKDWDFSHRRLRPQYPSATFQPYSKFKGTQQSDRQIYNVEVTILTVDIEQSNMSGYLQICGLTPDHPTLTTFFTGEIIGGPDQKYSFRTGDPGWGASDKTDLTHWARFPAWRPLSLHAKRNINFVYPMNHENWWQQEYIFMRWKEHFLVPDYKLKSIQGASFEGFYYICFNQIEGRLELKHEGKPGVWGMGVCPSIEFR